MHARNHPPFEDLIQTLHSSAATAGFDAPVDVHKLGEKWPRRHGFLRLAEARVEIAVTTGRKKSSKSHGQGLTLGYECTHALAQTRTALLEKAGARHPPQHIDAGTVRCTTRSLS